MKEAKPRLEGRYIWVNGRFKKLEWRLLHLRPLPKETPSTSMEERQKRRAA